MMLFLQMRLTGHLWQIIKAFLLKMHQRKDSLITASQEGNKIYVKYGDMNGMFTLFHKSLFVVSDFVLLVQFKEI